MTVGREMRRSCGPQHLREVVTVAVQTHFLKYSRLRTCRTDVSPHKYGVMQIFYLNMSALLPELQTVWL